MNISPETLSQIIQLANDLTVLPPPGPRPAQETYKPLLNVSIGAPPSPEKRAFRAFFDALPENERRDVVALYYLGRGEGRTLNATLKRIANLDAKHLAWTLLQSARLAERLQEGLRIHSETER